MNRWGYENGSEFVQLSERAAVRHTATMIGESLNAIPLHAYLPAQWGEDRLLVMAEVHGEEGDTKHVLSATLRSIQPHALRAAVILCANPDGALVGTRGNARNVNLNRNFPTHDWTAEPNATRWELAMPRETMLSSGTAPASEPEVQTLIRFITDNDIRHIVSLHSPLGVVDTSDTSWVLGKQLGERLALEVVDDIGYPTPGSMGTWAAENNIPLITLEFEDTLSLSRLRHKYGPALQDLLLARYPAMC
jgi:protein MpaA